MSELTRGRSGRFGFLVLAFALAVAMVTVVLQGSATGASHLTVTEDAGILLLSTGPEAGNNYIEYYANPDLVGSGGLGTRTASRSIVTSRHCDVTDFNFLDTSDVEGDSVGSLLAISDNGPRSYSGLVSNGFGVKTKNNCSTSQGRIGPDQTLTLALGDYFGESVAIDVLEVDVEGKFNAELSIKLGDDTAYTEALPAGDSDNGPDSGPSDNTLVTIGGNEVDDFETVKFASAGTTSAEVSIEGGGDGDVDGGLWRAHFEVNQTLFKLVSTVTYDGNILCGQGPVPAGGHTGPSSAGPAESGDLFRGDDTKTIEDCELILYTFQIEGDNVLFDYEDNGEGNRFLVRIDWDPGSYSPLAPPIRNVNYYNDDPVDYVPGVACTGSNDTFGAGPSVDFDYTHPVSTVADPIADAENSTFGPGTIVPVCLAGEQMVLTSAGWQQIQWWDVTGDPRWQ